MSCVCHGPTSRYTTDFLNLPHFYDTSPLVHWPFDVYSNVIGKNFHLQTTKKSGGFGHELPASADGNDSFFANKRQFSEVLFICVLKICTSERMNRELSRARLENACIKQRLVHPTIDSAIKYLFQRSFFGHIDLYISIQNGTRL